MPFSAYQETSENCEKIKKIQSEDPSTDGNLSMNTLMKEVKPIIKERYLFEHRDKSVLIIFWCLRTIKFPMQVAMDVQSNKSSKIKIC